jgi:hypothetical protein
MPVTHGIILDGYRSLPEVCAPLATEFERCFWVICVQSGPFDFGWLFESERNEALVERQLVDVPALDNSGTCVLRPGSIPRLANHLVVDEWSYFFAIDAPEPQVRFRAEILNRHMGDFSEPFLRRLDEFADLFICHIGGWWEFYCGRADWSRQLRFAWPDSVERALSQAGEAPTKGRGQ